MNATEELCHLRSGPAVDSRPGEYCTIQINATLSTTSDLFLCRCQEVLGVILENTGDPWPSVAHWLSILPRWFVEACAAEESEEESELWWTQWQKLSGVARETASAERGWTVSEWLHWMQPDEREWFWWDHFFDGPTRILVSLQTLGWPVPLGALHWLMTVSGAIDFLASND